MTQRANILLVGGVLALALSGIAVAGPLEDSEFNERFGGAEHGLTFR